MFHVWLTVCTLLSVTVLPAQGSFMQIGQPGVAKGVAWRGDFEKAFQQARETGQPLMVFITKNGDKTNEEIARITMRHPDVVRESRNFVCLVSCPGTHGSVDGVCERFGHVDCATHAKVERRVRGELLQTATVRCPQWIFYASDGKTVLLRHVWKLSAVELRNKMREAHRLSKKSTDPDAKDPLFGAATKQATGGHMERRREALGSLITMEDARVVAFMDKATSSRSTRVRRLEAIMAMGESGQDRFVEILIERLRSRDATTRSHAAVALEKIGDSRAGTSLFQALKKEKKADGRSNLLRALLVCCDDDVLREATKIVLKRASKSDLICGLWAAAQVRPDTALLKTIGKLIKSSSPQVRAAAYLAVGGQKLNDFEDRLVRRFRSEKNLVRICCGWALSELRDETYEGEANPEEFIRALLPDNHLREGHLEARRRRQR